MTRLSFERAALLGCVGVAAEIVFTALTDPSGGLRLIGYSYVWMLPLYALLYPGMYLMRPYVGRWAWPWRASAYAAGIMLLELITGLLLHAALGQAPWEPNYRGHAWCVLGVMRLDYFPFWAAGALVFERACRLVGGWS
jgi:hypothetical protein